MSRPASLEARLDRLEALDEIRQLAAKYCLALDMRDLDALCRCVRARARRRVPGAHAA